MRNLGIGLGLRPDHYRRILEGPVQVSWFEALTENYLGLANSGAGRPLKMLEKVREKFPIVLHGVSLSIGSTDPLDLDYLRRLKNLAERIGPQWVSDHLCWTGVAGGNLHDLLPLPYDRPTLEHVIARIGKAQDFLGREILFENVSSYLEYNRSEMTEWEFLSEITRRSGCKLLFDVNNVYVSSINHRFDPLEFIRGVPADRVGQIHLAGHSRYGECVIDTHDHPVCDAVWDLYAAATRKFGAVSTMVEWDSRIPEYEILEAEALRAGKLQEETLAAITRLAERPSAPL